MFGKSSPPVVLAHFMLGNTYSYSHELWTKQFTLAAEAGLDGFVLNLGPEEWQWAQALAAARLCPPAFRLALSLDMNVLPSDDVGSLADRVVAFARAGGGAHQLRQDGKAVLSTFGGGGLTLGGAGWSGLKKRLKDQGLPVYFVPAFFLPPRAILNDPAVDAAFAWNSAWELQGPGTGSAEEREFLASRKPYMAAVSPCFSTHYGTDPPWGWNKNWIYGTDDAWYARRWEQILGARRVPVFVQVLSWNDFGESHYIGPVEGSQPGSESWTEGMDHLPLLRLTAHFIRRLKSPSPTRRPIPPPLPAKRPDGTPTARAAQDEELVVIWYRPHRAGLITATSDAVGRPANASWASDTLSIYSSLGRTGAQLVVRSSSSSDGQDKTKSTVVDLPQGDRATSVAFTPGEQHLTVVRAGQTLCELQGRPIARDGQAVDRFNFNVWSGAMSF